MGMTIVLPLWSLFCARSCDRSDWQWLSFAPTWNEGKSSAWDHRRRWKSAQVWHQTTSSKATHLYICFKISIYCTYLGICWVLLYPYKYSWWLVGDTSLIATSGSGLSCMIWLESTNTLHMSQTLGKGVEGSSVGHLKSIGQWGDCWYPRRCSHLARTKLAEM